MHLAREVAEERGVVVTVSEADLAGHPMHLRELFLVLKAEIGGNYSRMQ